MDREGEGTYGEIKKNVRKRKKRKEKQRYLSVRICLCPSPSAPTKSHII
jgi:hypothetical protein